MEKTLTLSSLYLSALSRRMLQLFLLVAFMILGSSEAYAIITNPCANGGTGPNCPQPTASPVATVRPTTSPVQTARPTTSPTTRPTIAPTAQPSQTTLPIPPLSPKV